MHLDVTGAIAADVDAGSFQQFCQQARRSGDNLLTAIVGSDIPGIFQ